MEIDDVAVLKADVQSALDAIMAVLVRLDGLPDVSVPEDALDEALRSDEANQEARQSFNIALIKLRNVLGDEHLGLFLEVEELANGVVSKATDVGFRLGMSIASTNRTFSKVSSCL